MAIVGEIQHVIAQSRSAPRLLKGLQFLQDFFEEKSPDLRKRAEQLVSGAKFEVSIEGEDIFAIFQSYPPRDRAKGFFEAHKEFTDLQTLAQGHEYIEVTPLSSLSRNPVYDESGNVFFPLRSGPETRFLLRPGNVAALFPEDAHAPCLTAGVDDGLVLKIVVKVRKAFA